MPRDLMPEQIARELLASTELRGSELDRRVEQALSPGYWNELVPELSIGDRLEPGWNDAPALDDTSVDETARRFGSEGYLQLGPVLSSSVTTRMRLAVDRLTEHDWPAVFAWVYDECWRASRTPLLDAVCARILGAAYRQTPYVWTHVVASARGAAGWPPHEDNPGDTLRLTVWIPLTDATVDSGCMCVIPKHLAPADANGTRWYERPSLSKAEVRALLHASRPLPALAGSALAWDAGLLHWGLARQAAGAPRISLSMEFVSATGDAAALEGALDTGAAPLPSHEQRLGIIAADIALYQSSERRVMRFAPLADRLTARVRRT